MPIITFNALNAHLEKARESGRFEGVYLLFGDEMLCRQGLDALRQAMLPEDGRQSGYEPVDGAVEHLQEAIDRMQTYGLFASRKIVAVLDSKLFYAKADAGRLAEKVASALHRQQVDVAGRLLMQLTRLAGIEPEDLKAGTRDGLPGDVRALLPADSVLDALVESDAFLRAPATGAADPQNLLERALERGFPETNHLILTTDVVDRRKKLFKLLEEKALVVDCTLFSGGAGADRSTQDAFWQESARKALAEKGKRMDGAALAALLDKVGPNLRMLLGGIDKLADLVGKRQDITREDVETALVKTREDPVYLLTDAVSGRDVGKALEMCQSLLASEYHPLQILAALVNHFRKLLVVKDLMAHRLQGLWRSRCTYSAFQQQVLPMVVKADTALKETLADWQEMLTPEAGGSAAHGGKKTKGKSKAKGSDLLLAQNPRSGYAVFQLFRKADGFTEAALLEAMEAMCDADERLKTGGSDPRLVLERLIFSICGPGGDASPS